MKMSLYALGISLLTTALTWADDAQLLVKEESTSFYVKEAWFDFDMIFSKSLEYQDELDRIGKAVEDKEAEMLKLKKECDDAVAKLQNAGNTMKEDARERTIERVGELRQKLEIKRNSLDQYLQRERVTVQSKLMEKIYEAAAVIANVEGWDAINPLIPKKLVFNKKMDITDKVLVELNKGYTPKKSAKEKNTKDEKK